MRVCEWCGGPIGAERRSSAKTCSVQCSTLRHNRYASDRLMEKYQKREPLPPIPCERCGEPFTPYTRVNKYCSRRCQWSAATRAKRPRIRECSKCGSDVTTKPGIPVCDACKADPRDRTAYERTRRLNLYGLTQEAYDQMLAGQDGRCRICRTDDPGNGKQTWAIDHCRDSGQVRGILCNPCNLAIGILNDDPARLRAAAAYIEASRGETAESSYDVAARAVREYQRLFGHVRSVA